jgi:N-acetylglutamate synthase-like GNAT family acetyltransferase
MNDRSSIQIRAARREDIPAIIAMLADDKLGGPRERVEDPLPRCYDDAFAVIEKHPHIELVVAENGEHQVIGCLQLCVLPGLSSQGASRGLIEDVRVASDHRSGGIGGQLVQWAVDEARKKGCRIVELLTHETRVDAQRFYKRLGFTASHVGMAMRF